jgi:SulP family sulfate permease
MTSALPPQPIAVGLAARARRWSGASLAALSSTAAHAPENAAYGLMAMAPLGIAFGPTAMGLAVLGAALSSAVVSLLGAGRLAGDAGAALALLTGGLVGVLAQRYAADGPWLVLALVAAGVGFAGLLQALYGVLRLGGLVKFTPYPVRTGLSSGVGLLLIGGAAPALAGHGFAAGWPAGSAVAWGALLVGGVALVVTGVAARVHTRLPPLLLGLAAATALHYALAAAGWTSLSRAVGIPRLPDEWFGGPAVLPALQEALADPVVLLLLGSYAVTASVIASLDTLLAASIVDGRLRHTRDADRELLAQGLGNVASAAIGGIPVSPSVPASLGLVMQQPQQRHIVLFYAGALLVVLLGVPIVLGVLPTSAVAGVLVVLGASMISPTLWQMPLQAWHLRAPSATPGPMADRRGRMLVANWAVTVVVALGAVTLGIGWAVLIGATCAVLLFVRANMRDVVGRVWSGDRRRSLKTRPLHLSEALGAHGQRIAVLELQGALFFGTADALRARLQALSTEVDTAIVDLHQVGEVDVTAARILCETAADWERLGKPLVFAEWLEHDPRRGLVESMAREAGVQGALHFEAHADRALEHAEERLLQGLQLERGSGAALALADTLIARGLSEAELALLADGMTELHVARGTVLFRAGDPGDTLYVSLLGEIGLRMPGSGRRLASFAPGVTIGEMGLLAREPRSLEAVAESDVVVMAMSGEAFDRLLHDHPELAAKLLRNIALHLGGRVRSLTGDLGAWMTRSASRTG